MYTETIVGIVKVSDSQNKEHFYIGMAKGINPSVDTQHIIEYGREINIKDIK